MSESFDKKKSNINLLDEDPEFVSESSESDDLLLDEENNEKNNLEYIDLKKTKSNFIRTDSKKNMALRKEIKILKDKNDILLLNYKIQNEDYIKLKQKLKIKTAKNIELIKLNDKCKKKILQYKSKYIKIKKRESVFEESDMKFKLEQNRLEYNSNVNNNNIFYTNDEKNDFEISSRKKKSENNLKIEKNLDFEFICKTKNNIDYFQKFINDNLINKFEKKIETLNIKFEKKIFNMKKIIERYKINLGNKELKFRSFVENVSIYLQKTQRNKLFEVMGLEKNEKNSDKELDSLFDKSEKKLNEKNLIISSIKNFSNSDEYFKENEKKSNQEVSDDLKASNSYLEIGSEKEESGNPLFKKQQENENKKKDIKEFENFECNGDIFTYIQYIKDKNKQKMLLMKDIGLTLKSKFENFLAILEYIIDMIEKEDFEKSLNSENFCNEYNPRYLNDKNIVYFNKLDTVSSSYLTILDFQIKKKLLKNKFNLLRIFFGVIKESKIFDKKIKSGIEKKIKHIGETFENKDPNFKKINEDLDYLEEKFLFYLNTIEGENSKNLKNIKKSFNRSLSDNMLIAKENLNFQKKMEDFFVKFFDKEEYINNSVKIQEQIKLDYKNINFEKIKDEKFLGGILTFFFNSLGKIVNKKKFRLTDKSMQNQIKSFCLFFKKIRKIILTKKNKKKEKNLVLEDFDNVFENELMLIDFLGNLLNKFILNK